MYDAVIFDNDGVLVERPTERAMVRGARGAFEACGVEDPDPADLEAVLHGVTPDLLDRLAGTYGFDPDEFWAARDRSAAAAQREAVEAGERGTYHDTDAVWDVDVPAAVVSNNQQMTVDFLLERFELADRFVSAYGRSLGVGDLTRKKPDPHYLERAIADIETATGAAPERPLMVGDKGSDVRAARNAGIDAALLRRPDSDPAPSVSPDHELEGLDDLRNLLAEGPAGG